MSKSVNNTELKPNILEELNDRKIHDLLASAEKLYRKSTDQQAIDFEITSHAFSKLKGRPGIEGPNYSRLVQMVEDGQVTYHLITSPYTNVTEMKKKNSDETELTWGVRGFELAEFPVCIELCPITAERPAELKERSYIDPKDLIKMRWLWKEDAQQQIVKNMGIDVEK